jgi:hypothetical protein
MQLKSDVSSLDSRLHRAEAEVSVHRQGLSDVLGALALKADRRDAALLAPTAALEALAAVVARKHDKDAFSAEKSSLDEKIKVRI